MRVSIRMGFTSFFLWVLFSGLMGQHTQKIYLSGTGSADAVPWQFYVTAGMQAGKWSVINVPSCWELQGFGKYNYGFAKDSQRGKEHGIYKHRFMVPDSLKGKVINIVFEGVMTDATVKLNGKLAGPAHQGAFYAFKYNISELLKYGAYNQLEVTVAKHSANASVNAAERQGDFWIFGGIFRPVWLEVLPSMHIRKVRLDANAQGQLTCEVLASNIMQHVVLQCFDANGKPFGDVISAVAQGKDSLRLQALFSQPKLWSAEQPYLYTAKISIIKQQDTLHTITRKFGFRTVTLKPRDGLYVNGIKMKLKGINRHSFRPNTGRTTSPQISREDIALIKGMNMNAVRMSHYPPDEHFLDLCDSLGLYVMDELAGWHGHYDTPTGLRLLKEMLEHDANHPSIIMWANGNEGGHNTELDEWFAKWDIQQRPVVHPWENFGGFDTQHYREYNYGIGNFEQGNEIVLPTEFLHGQFDGGHGAGLQDYWEKMWQNPLSAGGFLWDLADNAVVRRDLNDSLDTDKHRAADGIVGPYHQKEASYYAIKEIWTPIFIERREISPTFDGTFLLENRYQFTNLIECSFSFKLTQFGQSNISDTIGTLVSPNIAPGNKGIIQVPLPSNWQQYQVLYLTATDAAGMEIFTWSYPLQLPATANADVIDTAGNAAIQVTESDSLFHLQVKDIVLSLHRYNGKLLEVSNETGKIPLSNGPVFEEGV
ncbi:MAG TPA: glycoside hydrolase family 2 TIM barrel-domain containing protein, partial [Phnomibacter sp.]|nr:glycoside hydrolase family 2 TIM barrel-domain containing protein [Phnomibacter sp.]